MANKQSGFGRHLEEGKRQKLFKKYNTIIDTLYYYYGVRRGLHNNWEL